MTNKSIGCFNKLEAFFKQWWDTAYSGSPAAGNRPQITGPGQAGGGFYDANGGCSDYGVDQPGTGGGTVPATLSLTLGARRRSARSRRRGQGLHRVDHRQRHLDGGRRNAVVLRSRPLMNGTFSLPSPLEVALSKSSWTGPTSNESGRSASSSTSARLTRCARVDSKTLTFTLSTTTP